MRSLPLTLFLVSVLAGSAPCQRDLTEHFVVPDGVRVTLYAESPMLFNPTALDVDERGRLWVTEAVNYRKWDGRNPGLEHPGGDRVIVLEDTDGDGAADRSTVFAQAPELVAPLGILVLGNRVLVSCSPRLLLFTDDDGDLHADRVETLLEGFGGFNHDHGLHSVSIGPDGLLYFNAGNAGPHVVTDRGGWTLRSGSCYCGGGPRRADNRPGLRSDDGRIWTGGIVLRMAPDGTGLRVLAHNFRNPYEVAVDSFGDLWQSDNDDDGNRGCRTTWVMEGGNYGYFSPDGSRTWQADRRPGQPIPIAHWHQDDPGVVPTGCINGAGGPTGVAVWEGGALDLEPGTVLDCDAGACTVYAHRPRLDGAGFALEKGELCRSRTDGEGNEHGRWFRPSDVVIGADGAVYVADWWDPGVGGHAARDREAYGRILRLGPPHLPAAKPFDLDSLEGLLAAFGGPVVSVRGRAAWALQARGVDGREALWRLSKGRDERLAARALLSWAGCPGAEVAALRGRLADRQPRLRITALRALRRLDPHWLEAAGARADDPSPAVRRALMVALRDVPLADCRSLLLKLAAGYDGRDRTYLEAFGIAADGKEAALYPELLAREEEAPASWSRRFAGLVWRLHPVAAVPALLARAMAPGLALAARRQALTALAFVPARPAAEAMLTLAQGGPADTQALAAWWLRQRDGNDWREYQLASRLATGRDQAELRWRSGTVNAGLHDFDVELRGGRTVWLDVTDGGNGNGCDWADWIAPKLVGPAGELALTDVGWLEARAGWGAVHVGKNADGGPLAVGGQRLPGIGTHAPSTIAFRVPAGYTHLVGRAGPDDGGTEQRGSATSVEFQVWVDAPKKPRADLAAWRATLADGTATAEARRAAAEKLALDGEGAAYLLALAEKGTIPADVRDAVAAAIFRNGDPAVRALATRHFHRPGAQHHFPPIPELVRRPGDARRGEQVFFAPKAACATCHRFKGRGRSIGPDLTVIREKYGKDGLLDAILDPSGGIAFGYEPWLIEMVNGDVLFGFLLADGDKLVIKDAGGTRHVIPADQVAARHKQQRSLMPETAALGLSERELVDLCAFLLEDRAATRRLGPPQSLFDGHSLAGWTACLPDGTELGDVWRAEDGVLHCLGNPIGYLRTVGDFESYELSVEWRTPPGAPPGNSGVLLRMVGEDKVWPKSIEAQLQAGQAGDLWNIDHFPMQVSAARTKGRRTLKLEPSSERPLGEWNRYRITLDGGDLELEVNGVVQNRASFCEVVPGKICLQSEGAAIEFKNIVLRPISHTAR